MFWNRRFITKLFEEKDAAIQWCQGNRLLPSEIRCPEHQLVLKINTQRHGLGSGRCRKGHDKEIALASGSWFEGSRLSIYQEMSIILSYADNASYEKVMKETAIPKKKGTRPADLEAVSILSSATVANRYMNLRCLIMEDFLERQEYRGKIGGTGKIDESKFGKRKYNRGRHTDGHWVLGLIENDSEDLRLVLCPNNKRGEVDLIPIIEKHVAMGTEIHTDCWKAYDKLNQMGYIHKRVNHSDKENPFITEDGIHTNRIESQ